MAKILKWLAFTAVAFALLLVAVAGALQQWLRTDDFRGRVEREATAALGVPLKLGRLSIDLFPLPAVAVDQAQLQTQPPLSVDRVEARPVWAALLAGRLEIATLVVRKAVLPQAGIAALGSVMQKTDKGGKRVSATQNRPTALVLPRSLVLDQITWVDESGQRMTMDAKADFGADRLLEDASFRISQGRFAGSHGAITREPDHWPVRVDIGGGRIAGKLQMQPGTAAGSQVLQGSFRTDDVEVAALTAPNKALTGKLQAQTTLRSEYRDIGQLADRLQTQTRFTVRDAVLQGIDLAKAVQTAGLSRGGFTRLETLAGQVSTHGKAVQVVNLVATSGLLSATGNVTIAPTRALAGKVHVDLAQGALGVPLVLGGTVDEPSVTMNRSGIAGAVAGAVTLGDRIKGLFGR